MSKRKQELVNSDLASKKQLALPAAVAGSGDREIADEVGVTEYTGSRFQNCDEYLMKKRKETKVNSRRTQLVALSKVVNRAFTGWTIKTQS